MSMMRRQCRHDLENACLKPRRRRRMTSLLCCPGMVYIWRGWESARLRGSASPMSLSHKMACGWMERALPPQICGLTSWINFWVA